MSIIYSILGLMALSVFFVVALPILLVILIADNTAAVAIFTKPQTNKIKLETGAAFSSLRLREEPQV